MVTGQTRALLENCFEKKQEKGHPHPVYEPVMIQMTLTRSFIEKSEASPDDPKSDPVERVKVHKMTFAIPLLCLIPINNLVVDKVEVDFDLEITSVTHKEKTSALAEGDPVIDRKATLNGKITNKQGGSNSKDSNSASRLKVNIHAAPLPLPLGLLSVLDIYSKSIQPVPAQKTIDQRSDNAA